MLFQNESEYIVDKFFMQKILLDTTYFIVRDKFYCLTENKIIEKEKKTLRFHSHILEGNGQFPSFQTYTMDTK